MMQKTFNTNNYIQLTLAKNRFDNLCKARKLIDLSEHDNTRTSPQNKARWLYLTMVSDSLNELGNTFYIEAIKAEVPFTKDLLYHVYWKTAQSTLFPDKKRLNKAEFSQLTEHVMNIFAMVFGLSIEFPDAKRITE